MTTCILCGAEITNSLDEYGPHDVPMCRSDWLSGAGWIYEDDDIVNELRHGLKLQEAVEVVSKKQSDKVQEWFLEAYYDLP